MRIVLTHLYAWPEVRRGAERYTHELGAGLLRAGHDVRIVSSAADPSDDRVLDVPVRRLRRRGYLQARYGESGLHAEFGLRALMRLGTARVDAWHAMSIGDAAAASLVSQVRRDVNSIYTEVGFPSKASRDRRADRRLYDYVVGHVDRFVCLSQPAGDLLRQDYGRAGDVVPGGVDTRAFQPAGPREPRPVLLFPSALSEPRKNVGLLLEAAALLARRGQPVDVWLVGPGELPQELSPLATEGLASVSVHRTASSEELPELYSQAWVTVLPSQAEVFGLVVLESMACGTPAVVLDDGLGPSILVTAETGRRSAPDAESVAQACEDALALAPDPRTAARCQARAAEFDWDTVVVPQFVAMYQQGR
jgi:glycosyltransferase involved in cell wall biosynthesis